MKVVGYCRVSTQEQAVNGTSTETQITSIKNECASFNYELVELYVDDGVSGKDDDRPALNRLRGDSRLRKFDCVMFTNLDRLGRDMRDLSNIAHDLKLSQIKLHCIDEPCINSGGLMFNIFGAFAEFERETIRARTELGRKAVWKDQSSVIGSLPYGYKKVNGKAEIDEITSEIYKKIVDMYLDQNYSMQDIAIKPTKDGVPIPIKSKSKSNANWSTSTISDILKNESYTGESFHNRYVFERRKSSNNGKSYSAATKIEKDKKEWIKITFPSLITKERFEQIQNRIKIQKKKPKKHHVGHEDHFLAESVLYCGYCGTRLRKIRTREGKFKYVCHWAYCSQSELFLSNKTKCMLKPIDESEADNNIFGDICEIIADPGHFAKDWLRETNLDDLKNKVSRLELLKKDLETEIKDGFSLFRKTRNLEIKKMYEAELSKKELEYDEVQNNLNSATKELSFAQSKTNYIEQYQKAIEDSSKREQFGIYFSTKAQFKTYLNQLTFKEKKRIIGAVISPEEGGKYFVRHPTLNDIVDDPRDIPANEAFVSLPDRGHILDGIFSIDLKRIASVVTSLNYSGLLNRVVSGRTAGVQEARTGGVAPAPGRWPRDHFPRRAVADVPLGLHARCGHEPLPLWFCSLPPNCKANRVTQPSRIQNCGRSCDKSIFWSVGLQKANRAKDSATWVTTEAMLSNVTGADGSASAFTFASIRCVSPATSAKVVSSSSRSR